MKWLPLLVLSACLAACRSASEAPGVAREPADSHAPAEIDLAGCAGQTMSAEAFVRVCQNVSGFNFTYPPEVASALRTTSLRVPDLTHVAASAFSSYLDAAFAPTGLVCKRVGPEPLKVYVIERRAS